MLPQRVPGDNLQIHATMFSAYWEKKIREAVEAHVEKLVEEVSKLRVYSYKESQRVGTTELSVQMEVVNHLHVLSVIKTTKIEETPW